MRSQQSEPERQRRAPNAASPIALLVTFAFAGAAWSQPPHERKGLSDAQDIVFFAPDRPLLIRVQVYVDGKSYRAAWDELVGKVMKFMDTDADSTLSKAEVSRMSPIQILTGVQAFNRVGAAVAMEAIDSNKDGKVSTQELGVFLRRNGMAPFQVGSAAANPFGAQVITIGDAPSTAAEAVNSAVFALLDKDKDGKLSKVEFSAAPKLFAGKDANDDEMITAQELAPLGAPAQQRGGALKNEAQQAAVVVRRAGQQETDPANNLVMLIQPNEPGAALARQLLARYGKMGSKTLKAADVGLDLNSFARLDADKNGSLDAEELAQFARRAPDVELAIRIGKKAGGHAEVEGKVRPGVDASIQKSKNGIVSLEFGVTQVEMHAGAVASNVRIPAFRLRDQYVNQFKAADGDNNGYLDEQEARRSRLLSNLFKALDSDGDGMLFEKELVAYIDRIEELQKAVQAGCVTLAMFGRGSGLFGMMDRDQDGRLSVREQRRAVELPQRLDRDKDGMLARAEIPRNYELRVRQGPAGAGDFGSFVVVAKARMGGRTTLPERDSGPAWFRKMDSNLDGDLSPREFLGDKEDFQRLDSDRDGLVSASEAEKASQK